MERLTAANFLLIEDGGVTSARPEALDAMTDRDQKLEPPTVDLPLQRGWATGAVLGGLFHVRGMQRTSMNMLRNS